MKKKVLNKYVVEHLKSVEKELSAFKKEMNPEHLHRLRVDFKKIKAVFYFAEKVYDQEFALSKKLRALFYKAGKIRELDINIQMLLVEPNPPRRLIDQLKKEKRILILRFLKKTSIYLQLTERYIKSISLPQDLPKTKVIKKYFQKEEENAKRLLSGDRESMHKYRMKLKHLMYVSKALPEKMQKKIDWNVTEIDKLQEKLGQWHDTYAAIHFFSQMKFPKKSAEFISTLKEKEKAQFNSLFSK